MFAFIFFPSARLGLCHKFLLLLLYEETTAPPPTKRPAIQEDAVRDEANKCRARRVALIAMEPF